MRCWQTIDHRLNQLCLFFFGIVLCYNNIIKYLWQRPYGLQSQKYLLSGLNRKVCWLLVYLKAPEGSKNSDRGEIFRENLRKLSCHWGHVLILDEGGSLRIKVWPKQRAMMGDRESSRDFCGLLTQKKHNWRLDGPLSWVPKLYGAEG